jgi:hypothetical protein
MPASTGKQTYDSSLESRSLCRASKAGFLFQLYFDFYYIVCFSFLLIIFHYYYYCQYILSFCCRSRPYLKRRPGLINYTMNLKATCIAGLHCNHSFLVYHQANTTLEESSNHHSHRVVLQPGLLIHLQAMTALDLYITD